MKLLLDNEANAAYKQASNSDDALVNLLKNVVMKSTDKVELFSRMVDQLKNTSGFHFDINKYWDFVNDKIMYQAMNESGADTSQFKRTLSNN